MAYGISVKNASGHILISNEIESLHFAGQATYVSTPYTGLTSFPNYNSSDPQNVLSGRCITRYRIDVSDTPLFFIRPDDYTRYHGIINQWESGGYWYVDVIQSGGTEDRADVYAFVKPSALTPSGSYGIQTFLSNGTSAFDSRLNPLAITYAAPVTPPSIPCDGGQPTAQSGFAWNDTNLDHDFTSDNTYSQSTSSALNSNTDLMFSAPSTAQAVYSRVKHGHKASTIPFWQGGGTQHHYSTAIWWAMYHQAYKLVSGNIRAGWCPYAAGYYFYSVYQSGGWFGGGSGSAVTGNAPYNDKTINLSANTVIIANAEHYT